MKEQSTSGSLSALNVAGGDVKITFDKDNLPDQIRAARIIKDMLARGYALIIEVDGAYQRVKEFDEKHNEYIIADFESTKPEIADAEIETPQETSKAKPRGSKRVPMASTNAVGVARSAGG